MTVHKARSSSPSHPRGSGRSRLNQAVGARGRRLQSITYTYAPKVDLDVVLGSNPAFAHFLWLEADPSVLRYDLEPESLWIVENSVRREVKFDCLVESKDRKPELRIFRFRASPPDSSALAQQTADTRAAHDAGFEILFVDREILKPRAQLIHNWRTALSLQSACRHRSLVPQSRELIALVDELGPCDLDALLSHTDPDLRPVYQAALCQSLQRGELHSDVHLKPLCAATRIYPNVPAEAPHA